MWRELFALAYQYLRQRGLSHSDAEDLAQDTILATYRNLDGISPGSLHAWVRVVARNKHLDLVRQRARIVTMPELTESADPHEDPLALAMATADRDATRELIARLSPGHRRLIELRYVEDHSVNEVAELLGKPVNTVKVGLFRARKRLRAEIEKGRS